MSIKIRTLNIKSFRGIPELNLNLDGKSLILCGDNGAGKSSVVNAIEYLFTGELTHLKGSKSLSIKKHIPFKNISVKEKKVEETKVELVFKGDSSIERSFSKKEPRVPDKFQDFFDLAKSGKFILHRAELLSFILSKPADRFHVIGEIIGIGNLDNYEIAMMRARDKNKGILESLKEKKKKKFHKISIEFNSKMEILMVIDVLLVIEEFLRKMDYPPLNSLDKITKYIEEIYVIEPENLDHLQTKIDNFQRNIKGLFQVSPEWEEIEKKLDHIINFSSDLPELNGMKNGNLYTQFWDEGIRILHQRRRNENKCPFCEQTINNRELIESVKDRLEKNEQLSQKYSEYNRIISNLEYKLRNFFDSLIKLTNLLERDPKFKEEVIANKNLRKKLKNTFITLENFQRSKDKDMKQNLIQIFDDFNILKIGIMKKFTENRPLIREISTKEKKSLNIIKKLGNLQSNLVEIEKMEVDLKKFSKSLKYSEKIYSTFSKIKKKNINEVYNKIQEKVQEYYRKIHTEDDQFEVEIQLDKKKRASVNLKTKSKFVKKREDPRAYCSEGQLDSLGLCIFLAFINEYQKDCPLMILDDVISSVDANHRGKIAELLTTEFSEKQLIITTHDKTWFKHLKRVTKPGKFIYLDIKNQDPLVGPIIRNKHSLRERIINKIENGDEYVINDSRIFLEEILRDVCERFVVDIPFKGDGRYTVMDFFPKLNKRIRGLIQEGKFRHKVIKILDDIDKNEFLGNIGSHFTSDNLSFNEVKNFSQAVLNLKDGFQCETCQKPLYYDSRRKEIYCKQKKCLNSVKAKTK